MKLFGIVGWKNTGKTGLVARLVAECCARGLSVSTIKHTHHAIDLDRPDSDSHRHRVAGASEVMLASASRFALMREHRGAEPGLDDLVARLAPVDLVLAEGFKTARHPKIETHRAAAGQALIAPGDPTVLAVASDVAHPGLAVPVLPLDDTRAIADFVLKTMELR